MPFGDITTGRNSSDINYAGVLSPSNSRLKIQWCVKEDKTLRGIQLTVDGTPNYTMVPLTQFGNLTYPYSGEPGACFNQNLSASIINITVFFGSANIVGL